MPPLRDGVTIVMTVYNKQAWLPAVIAAIKHQACILPLEVIVVDDGSRDDSLACLQALLADMRDVLIIRQDNAGPTHAFNRGLALSGTRYTKGLDGDDILAPDAINRLLAALSETKACRWAYGKGVSYRDFPPVLDRIWSYAAEMPGTARFITDPLRESLRRAQTTPSAWIAETDLIRSVGFCDERVFIQDYSIELRLAAASPVAVLDAPVFHFYETLDENRLSANEAQILHDVNLAVAHLFKDQPGLRAAYGRLAARRATGRAWHWAQRRAGQSILSGAYWDFVRAHGGMGSVMPLLSRACGRFGAGIRKAAPPPTAPYTRVTARGVFASTV